MTTFNQSRLIGVFAPTGHGKTYLVGQLLKELSANNKIIIYDTDLEKSKLMGLYSFGENVTFYEPDLARKDSLSYLNKFIQAVRGSTSNIYLYIEDLDKFFDTATSLSKASVELKGLASDGRHQRIGLIYSTKQPSFIPSKLISNTNLFYIGQFSEFGDLKKFRPMLKNKMIKYKEKEIDAFEAIRLIKKPYFVCYDRWNNELKIV